MAKLGMTEAERDAVEKFRRDVVEPSMTSLILLDFWSERADAGNFLAPLLDKVAADYAERGVKLARINVDEDKLIAAQFRIESIPTIYAFFQGQPVADLSSARTEAQLTGAIDQILAQLPVQGEAQAKEAELEPLIAMGEQVLGEGDAERAASIFRQVLEMAPEHPEVISGLARALIAAGKLDDARAALDSVPEKAGKDTAIARARSALALADAAPAGDTAELEARIAADPDDHQARLDFAGALLATGNRDAAADQLLDSIARDREWNDGAARKRLLQILEAVGIEDPWAGDQRRRLSAILFG